MSSYFFGHEPPPYEDVSHRPSFTPSNAHAHHTSSPPFSQRILTESEDQWLHFDDPFNAYIAEPFPSNETNTLDPSLFTSNPIAPIPVFTSHPENNDQFMEKRNVSISPALLDKSTKPTEQVKWYSTGKEVQIGGPPPSVHGGKGKSQQGGKGKIHEEGNRDDSTEGSGQVKGKGKRKGKEKGESELAVQGFGQGKGKGKGNSELTVPGGQGKGMGKEKGEIERTVQGFGQGKGKGKGNSEFTVQGGQGKGMGKGKGNIETTIQGYGQGKGKGKRKIAELLQETAIKSLSKSTTPSISYPPSNIDERKIFEKTISTGLPDFPRLKIIFREPSPTSALPKQFPPFGTKTNPLDLASIDTDSISTRSASGSTRSGSGIREYVARPLVPRVTPPAAKDIGGRLLPKASELQLDENTPPPRTAVSVKRGSVKPVPFPKLAPETGDSEPKEKRSVDVDSGDDGFEEVFGEPSEPQREPSEPQRESTQRKVRVVEVVVPYKKLRKELYTMCLSRNGRKLYDQGTRSMFTFDDDFWDD